MKLKLLGFNSGLRKEFRFSFALQVLGADENVADESIGFHAQQAVENGEGVVPQGSDLDIVVLFSSTPNLEQLAGLRADLQESS
ncbi:MAG: hypothetical protein KAG92_01980 [Deltaproteobacteria bacterium]|nr:hypothetical protein [Deltaproteobacteria bacterium]